MKLKIIAIILLLSVLSCFAQEINNFTFAQIVYEGGNWDPNPESWANLYDFIITNTNIHAESKRKELTLNNKDIFNYPFVILAGDSEFNEFSDSQIETFKRYFDGGGICLIDDASGILDFGFDKSVKKEFKKIFPNSNFQKIRESDAVFYAFYLVPKVTGTKSTANFLEGIEYNNQMTVIYSHNDLLGIWEKDKLGNFLKECVPFGETQRHEAIKLTVNIFMHGLTGTYKLDAIHTNFIKQKLEFKLLKEGMQK